MLKQIRFTFLSLLNYEQKFGTCRVPVKHLFVIEIFELHANINVTLSKCSSKDLIKKKTFKDDIKKGPPVHKNYSF